MVAAPTPLSRCSNLLLEALPSLRQSTGAQSQDKDDSTSSESNHALRSVEEASTIAKGLDEYIHDTSTALIVPARHPVAAVQVRAVWGELIQKTHETNWRHIWEEDKQTTFLLNSGMCSGTYEATVLQQFALMSKARRILEIGMFTGTTTLALALLPNVETVTALDIEPFLDGFNLPFWQRAGVENKIQRKYGDARESLRALAEQKQAFDMIFIDADKPSYRAYVEMALELDLLADDGTILADNTLYKGLPFAPNLDNTFDATRNTGTNNQSREEATAGIVEFNDWVKNNDQLVCSILPIRDGISVIRRAP